MLGSSPFTFGLEAKLAYASNPMTPPSILEMLAQDENWAVRRRLASHPALPPSASLALAADPSADVRAELAMNPSVPAGVMPILVSDKDFLVRMALAKNPSLTTEIALLLARDANVSVREALAGNPRVASEILERLLDDGSLAVRVQAMRNPSLSPLALAQALLREGELRAVELLEVLKPLPYLAQEILAERGGDLLRATLAQAPWVDGAVKARLRNDPVPFVRGMASLNREDGAEPPPSSPPGG